MADVSSATAKTANNFGNLRTNDSGQITLAQKVGTIDINEYMDAVKEVASKRAAFFSDQITTSTDKVLPAIESLRTIAANFQKASKVLENYLGANASDAAGSVFRKKILSATGDGSLAISMGSNSHIEGISVNVFITQLATSDRLVSNASNTFASVNNTISGGSGSLVIGGTTVASITDGVTTLSDLTTAINSHTGTTGVRAYVTNTTGTDAGPFRLVLESANLGEPIDLTGTDASLRGTTGLYLPTSTTTETDLLAQYTVNNIAYTAKKNSGIQHSELDMTLEFQKTSTVGTQGTITFSKTDAQAAIENFISTYNSLYAEIKKHKEAELKGKDFVPKETATLYGKTIVSDLDQLLQQVGNAWKGLGSSDFKSLSEIGITTVKYEDISSTSDYFSVDSTKLMKSLDDNYDKVKRLFGNAFTSTNENIGVRGIPNILPATIAGKDITVTFLKTATGYDITYSGSGIPTETFSGGAVATPQTGFYAGLYIEYTGPTLTEGASINSTVNVSQGIAAFAAKKFGDAVYKRADQKAVPNAGETLSLFDRAVYDIVVSNTSLQEQADTIKKRADDQIRIYQSMYNEFYGEANKLLQIQQAIKALESKD